jgi:glucosamine-6-phosphate deaminase
MKVKIFRTKQQMCKAAAEKAAEILISTIKKKGEATFIAATGASQFEFLENLTSIHVPLRRICRSSRNSSSKF